MGGRIGVVSSSKVPVVASDDGVSFALLDVLSVPLTNARSTCVGQDQAPNIPQWLVLEGGGGGEKSFLP